MKSTAEIPRKEWQHFFDSFSNAHRGWLTTLEVFDTDRGDQVEARNMPLAGVLADVRHRGKSITILLGDSPDSHITHSVDHPRHVWRYLSKDGADEAVTVQSDGMTTLLHFRAAMRTECVDGTPMTATHDVPKPESHVKQQPEILPGPRLETPLVPAMADETEMLEVLTTARAEVSRDASDAEKSEALAGVARPYPLEFDDAEKADFI